MAESTAMQPAPTHAGALNELLQRARKQIEVALPRHLTAERMIRVAITAVSKTPALQECSPLSIVGCVIQSAELGLELSNPLGHAYMVPYRNKHTGQKEAQFQIGYRGLQELAYRSGRVSSFPAHVVFENDSFVFEYGTKPILKHKPTLSEPGPAKAVYAVIVFKDGSSDFEVMSVAQIEAHRKRYSKDSRQDSAWNTAWDEMAKKTVIRRLAKRAPLSADIVRAAVADEYVEAGIGDYAGVLSAPVPAQVDERTKAITDKLHNGSAAPTTPPPPAPAAPSDSGPAGESESGGLHGPSITSSASEAEEDQQYLTDEIERAAGDQAALRGIWDRVNDLEEKHGPWWESLMRELLAKAGYKPESAHVGATAGRGAAKKARDTSWEG